MVLHGWLVLDHLNVVHLDTLSVTKSLVLDKGDKFHHFAMRLDLSHVLLDCELLAAEQTTLLALVYVQAGKGVDEQVGAAVVIVSLNHDVCLGRGLLPLLLLELDGTFAEVVGVDQDVVIVTRLVGEGLRNHMLL